MTVSEDQCDCINHTVSCVLSRFMILTHIPTNFRRVTTPLGKHLPTLPGSWMVVFAAAINATDSWMSFPAACKEAAELSNASPTPPDEIAKLFNLLLSLIKLLTAINDGGQVFRPASHISLLDYGVSSDWIFTLTRRGVAKPSLLPSQVLQSLRINNI